MAIQLHGTTGISASGNIISAANITAVGNVNAMQFVGNGIQNPDGNITINTGAQYSWTFDNVGQTRVPGPLQLVVYANTIVRNSAITNPTAGMMIYVTGVGMQVYGATQWNTIAGSGN